MIEIIGRLLNNRADQTRVYEIPDRNLSMYVCYRFDEAFVRSEKRLDVPGLYILLWPMSRKSGVRDIYIGQTSGLSRRFSEHIKKRDFDCACMFSLREGRFTKTQTLYLEYLAIVSAMEYGNVTLMENYQIPQQPEIEREDMRRMDEVFDMMRLLMDYAGYGYIFEKKHITLRDANESVAMLRRLQNVANERARSKPLFDDDDEIDDEMREMVSYEVHGDGFKAVAIPMTSKGSYFIMPNSGIAPYVCLEDLSEEVMKSVEVSSRSLPRGLEVSSLSEAAEVITGRCDASVWTMNRQII